jgi:hypothetical protein
MDSPEMLMNRLLNDNMMLIENQKKFIDKYLDDMDSSSACTSSEL